MSLLLLSPPRRPPGPPALKFVFLVAEQPISQQAAGVLVLRGPAGEGEAEALILSRAVARPDSYSCSSMTQMREAVLSKCPRILHFAGAHAGAACLCRGRVGPLPNFAPHMPCLVLFIECSSISRPPDDSFLVGNKFLLPCDDLVSLTFGWGAGRPMGIVQLEAVFLNTPHSRDVLTRICGECWVPYGIGWEGTPSAGLRQAFVRCPV